MRAALFAAALALHGCAATPPAPAQARPAPVAPGVPFVDCDGCPELVRVPAGAIQVGSPEVEPFRDDDESPLHTVVISRPFALGRYPVTRDEFARFVRATGHRAAPGCWIFDGTEFRRDARRDWREPGFAQQPDHPVTCVSWHDAVAYTEWLGRETGRRYRLPSEAEWEYAARAGATGARYWNPSASGCAHVNWAGRELLAQYPDFDNVDAVPGLAVADCEDPFVFTAPVGSFPPNGFGLFDMLGNVFEWQADCWFPDYVGASGDGAPRDAKDCERRVARGGSWFDRPLYVRLANRFAYAPEAGLNSFGFRVLREL